MDQRQEDQSLNAGFFGSVYNGKAAGLFVGMDAKDQYHLIDVVEGGWNGLWFVQISLWRLERQRVTSSACPGSG